MPSEGPRSRNCQEYKTAWNYKSYSFSELTQSRIVEVPRELRNIKCDHTVDHKASHRTRRATKGRRPRPIYDDGWGDDIVRPPEWGCRS